MVDRNLTNVRPVTHVSSINYNTSQDTCSFMSYDTLTHSFQVWSDPPHHLSLGNTFIMDSTQNSVFIRNRSTSLHPSHHLDFPRRTTFHIFTLMYTVSTHAPASQRWLRLYREVTKSTWMEECPVLVRFREILEVSLRIRKIQIPYTELSTYFYKKKSYS